MAATNCTLTASTKCAVRGTYPPPGVTGDLASYRVTQSAPTDTAALTFGTGSGQVDLITCSDRTLTAGASATYDLYTGTDLPDLAGLACAFRKVKFIQISIASGGDAAGVTVGNAASNGWAGFFGAAANTYTIFPDGPPLQGGSPAGVAVGSTTKNLKILNNGAVSATVRVLIAGTSA